MWATRSRTPYAVGHTWGRNRDGVHEWIVAVRATFDILADGRVRLADEQPPPLLAPEYHGEDGGSSLKFEADLVPPKPTTDVLVNGTAYAPRGRPSTEFEVVLQVAKVQKSLRVLGRRFWLNGPMGVRPSATAPVTTIPIVYEHAYGGHDASDPSPARHKMDARNPVGRGVATDDKQLIDKPLHNFEYMQGRPDKTGPAGFGAIASYWSPRIELQGTYDHAWDKQRKPLLPNDWDPRSLLCSPADQRPESHLRGGELVGLWNMTPDGLLRFALPKIYLTFTTHFSTVGGRRSEEHRGRLSSVIIEPDQSRLTMVWASSLLVHQDEDYLEETIVREKPYI